MSIQLSAPDLTVDEAIAQGMMPVLVVGQEWMNELPAPARPEFAHAFGLPTTDFQTWAYKPWLLKRREMAQQLGEALCCLLLTQRRRRQGEARLEIRPKQDLKQNTPEITIMAKTKWTASQMLPQNGKVMLVTGANISM